MNGRIRRVMMLLALVLVLAALWLLPLEELLDRAASWSQAHPVAGPLIYLVVFPLCVVFLVPASWIAMFAGYVYGFTAGAVLASVGASLGAWAAFVNGRTLARQLVKRRMQSHARLQALDTALAEKSFLVVFLTRIALVIPYNLLNYMYSLTSIRPLPYIVPSVLGIIPAMSLFVFLGTQAKSVEQILSGELETGRVGVMVLIVSTIAVVAVAVILQRFAGRVLNRKFEE